MHLFLFFDNWKMVLYAFQDVFCGKIKLSKGDWKQEISIVFWNLLPVYCLLCLMSTTNRWLIQIKSFFRLLPD
jgi:hypothetical protein